MTLAVLSGGSGADEAVKHVGEGSAGRFIISGKRE